ncbi:O-glycosyl hydrolase [Streptomyces sp. SAI-218]
MSHRSRTSPTRTGATALALALAVTGLGFMGGETAHAADPVAQVWVTTPDGSRRLSPDGSLAFNSSAQGIDLRIDANQRGQRYTGAGASVTGASARLIQGLPQDRRSDLMRSLFSTSGDGIGLSYLRQPLGSSDFDATNDPHSYEDTRGQFSIDRDRQEIIPVVKQALGVNPSIRLMGTPWSPPAWMKTNNSLNGGSLKPENYGDFADYLVKTIKAYGQEGIILTDLTVQNEPENPTSYPSMSMTSAQQADFIKVLDPKLTAAGLPTNILAFDHNWDHPNYPLDVFSRTSGINRVIGAAFHCYGGSPSAQQQVINAGRRVFFTECSGTDSSNPASTFGDSLRWQAENLVVQNMRNGGETVVTWNLALDQNGGPHQGLCGTRCNGVVEIAGGNVNRGAEYYSLGHISKFVKVGATRIGSTSQGGGRCAGRRLPEPGRLPCRLRGEHLRRRPALLPHRQRPVPRLHPAGRCRGHLRVEPGWRRLHRTDRLRHLVPGGERGQRRLPGRRRLGYRQRHRPAAVGLRRRSQPEVAVPVDG